MGRLKKRGRKRSLNRAAWEGATQCAHEYERTELIFVVMTDEFPAVSREQPSRKRQRGRTGLLCQM
jgi:hypothetical protein